MRPNPFVNIMLYRYLKYPKISIEEIWHLGIIFCIFLSVSIFLAELFFHFSLSVHNTLMYMEFVVLTVLIVDLFVEFIVAKDKFIFLKKNWLLIIAVIPIARFIELGNTVRMIGLLRVGVHSSRIVEAESLMSMAFVGSVQKGLKVGMHSKYLIKEGKKMKKIKKVIKPVKQKKKRTKTKKIKKAKII